MLLRLLRFTVIVTIVVAYSGCDESSKSRMDNTNVLIDFVEEKFAPDRRVAIFDISMELTDGVLSVSGVSDQPVAIKYLLDTMAGKGYRVANNVRILPDSTVGEKLFGVINNSVGNMRYAPKHSAELVTQALLGTIVKIKRIYGEWCQIQTPDGYIAWIDHGGVQLVTAGEAVSWKNADKVLVTVPVANVKINPWSNKVVSDVVMGGKLKLVSKEEKYFEVEYPDGRKGIIEKKYAQRYFDWKSDLKPDGNLVESYARQLMGIPYLWGGTSTKGVDCSGFTKTVFMMNGLIIPRDASQQVQAGISIEPGKNFENLKKGDLVFFGKPETDTTKQKTTHVGIWLGKQEFIHSSQRVKLGSFDSESDLFDEINLNRFLEAKRLLGDKIPGVRPY